MTGLMGKSGIMRQSNSLVFFVQFFNVFLILNNEKLNVCTIDKMYFAFFIFEDYMRSLIACKLKKY